MFPCRKASRKSILFCKLMTQCMGDRGACQRLTTWTLFQDEDSCSFSSSRGNRRGCHRSGRHAGKRNETQTSKQANKPGAPTALPDHSPRLTTRMFAALLKSNVLGRCMLPPRRCRWPCSPAQPMIWTDECSYEYAVDNDTRCHGNEEWQTGRCSFMLSSFVSASTE